MLATAVTTMLNLPKRKEMDEILVAGECFGFEMCVYI